MKVFYTSEESEIDHVQGISIVQDVLSAVRKATEDPLALLTCTCDFFGKQLDGDHDPTLASLQVQPLDSEIFKVMMLVCLKSVISVLERQYKHYFEMDITDQLSRETESARSHNIDSEEVMGMFSANKQRAKNPTVHFLTARIRARKNCVVAYLDDMYKDQQENVIKWTIGRAREKKKVKKHKQNELKKELSKRSAAKRQKKTESAQKQLEKQLKSTDLNNLESTFPQQSGTELSTLKDILSGKIIGRNLCHTWYDRDKDSQTTWNSRIQKLKTIRRVPHFRIAYWEDDETFEDAADYDISKWSLAADFVSKDVVLC